VALGGVLRSDGRQEAAGVEGIALELERGMEGQVRMREGRVVSWSFMSCPQVRLD
jgi:hypothetical protein